MLATLIRPDEGDALVDGTSVVRQPELVRKKIGFLTSELKPEEFFTPNALFDFFAELHQIEPALAKKRKEELFERFGISQFAEVKVAKSGVHKHEGKAIRSSFRSCTIPISSSLMNRPTGWMS